MLEAHHPVTLHISNRYVRGSVFHFVPLCSSTRCISNASHKHTVYEQHSAYAAASVWIRRQQEVKGNSFVADVKWTCCTCGSKHRVVHRRGLPPADHLTKAAGLFTRMVRDCLLRSLFANVFSPILDFLFQHFFSTTKHFFHIQFIFCSVQTRRHLVSKGGISCFV